MFGDPNQLKPIVISNMANEATHFAQLSPLEILVNKNYDHLFLDMQYRMCPAMTSFPARHFYEGRLFDYPSTSEENQIRLTMRKVSYDYYDIDGPKYQGFEYWFVDVKNDVSRLVEGGLFITELGKHRCYNHGHESIHGQRNLSGDINVLTLYLGQKKLVLTKIRAKASEWIPDASAEQIERKWAIGDVCTVDSFQGK
jgi:hypothetical protein